jgi:N-acetylmuramoyl-L-alanine amidase
MYKNIYKGVVYKFSIALTMLVCVSLSKVYAIDEQTKPGNEKKNSLTKIIIDPGHGGQDPGALGKNHKEKDVVLDIALKVGKIISQRYPDVDVNYTRSTDVFVPLHERADIANRHNAELFISIHANANKNKDIRGIETYAMGLHKNESNFDVAKKENAAIIFEKDYTTRYEGFDPNSAESYIMFSSMQNTYLIQSLDFAGLVQSNSSRYNSTLDRGVRQAGFLVLWKTAMPGVLVEVGFISNPDEERYLTSEAGQMEVANGIANAIGEYKKRFEQKSFYVNNTDDSASKTLVFQDNSDSGNVVSVETNDESVNFKIQILTSQKKVSKKDQVFKHCKKLKLNNSIAEFRINSTYKYTIGSTNQYSQAVELASEVKKYYPQAFIVAVKDGQIVPLQSVTK